MSDEKTNWEPPKPEKDRNVVHPQSARSFDFGLVLKNGFSSFSKNIVRIIITALIVSVVQFLIVFALMAALKFTGETPILSIIATISLLIFLALPIIYMQITADFATYTILTDKAQSAVSKWHYKRSILAVLPISFILLIYLLGSYLGYIAFIVPGIILFAGWAVIGPVYLHENTHLLDSFGRSWSLTKGHKLKIFLLQIILRALIYTIGFVSSWAIVSIGEGGGVPANLQGHIFEFILVTFLLLILPALNASVISALYIELKTIKEGVISSKTSIQKESTLTNHTEEKLSILHESSTNWEPPKPEDDRYAVKDERAPWGRWLVGALALGLILFGALWLVTKVIIPSEVPNRVVDIPQAEKTEPMVTKSADDEAWVRALEKDTLEGYREYLAAFPEGRHKEDAQREIDAYDNKAWETAEQRRTIAGYEDYLEAWPEGLHASKAREKIAEMKARTEAIAKDTAERAAQEKADWENAARTNSVDSYGQYLVKHPAGEHASEAQNRIDRLKVSAADQAAWDQAKAANRAAAYQQYLTSFPQGAYVAQAIAAIEQLKPAAGRTFKDCSTCPTMVSLASGNANLGAGESESDARPNEKPQRPVTFSDMFAIGVTEVTFAEWSACVADSGCTKKPSNNGWGGGNRPVINVSWDDAQKYAAWLSSKTGMSYSLPSEAQWEYAARAGDSGIWTGGSQAALCAFANGAAQESGLKWANSACTDPAADRTLPVGMLGTNKFGVKDMIGNVAEWTLDCNTLNLRDAPTDGKADQRGSCNQRVVRGGSWFSGPSDLRFAARLMQRRGDSNDFTGFRVVRKIEN